MPPPLKHWIVELQFEYDRISFPHAVYDTKEEALAYIGKYATLETAEDANGWSSYVFKPECAAQFDNEVGFNLYPLNNKE